MAVVKENKVTLTFLFTQKYFKIYLDKLFYLFF